MSVEASATVSISGGEEHPCLRGVEADVVEDRVELGDTNSAGSRGSGHADGVLRGQRDDAGSRARRRGKRLQVGLDASPPPESDPAIVRAL